MPERGGEGNERNGGCPSSQSTAGSLLSELNEKWRDNHRRTDNCMETGMEGMPTPAIMADEDTGYI